MTDNRYTRSLDNALTHAYATETVSSLATFFDLGYFTAMPVSGDELALIKAGQS